MTCFRDWRGLVAALLLLPLAALLIGRAAGPAEAQGAQTSPDRPSLSTSEQRVRPNELVTVRGRFRPASTQSGGVGGSAAPASQPVRIQFRALGSKHWRDARSTRAGKAGRFKERVKIERSGRIRAVSADGRATPTLADSHRCCHHDLHRHHPRGAAAEALSAPRFASAEGSLGSGSDLGAMSP